MEFVSIHDKNFRPYLSAPEIDAAVTRIAGKLNHDLKDKEVVFLVVLNGAFMFAADLLKKIKLSTRISFVKLTSYEGTRSSGQVQELIGINEIIKDKVVVLVEDIIDTGNTLNKLLENTEKHQPAEIRVVSLLLKPDVYACNRPVDYVGIHVPDEFVVGYGLDYDGFGRNLNEIYTVVEL